MEDTIKILKESIVLPLTRPELFPKGSSLLRAPSGVLLHGPPGCGKTLVIKALAKETNCSFISLKPSTFMDRWYAQNNVYSILRQSAFCNVLERADSIQTWQNNICGSSCSHLVCLFWWTFLHWYWHFIRYGETQKRIDAIFSLAEKVAPVIIFIDEIDAFFRERSEMDNEIHTQTKAQFMFMWDGFSSAKKGSVVIVSTCAMNKAERSFFNWQQSPTTCSECTNIFLLAWC